MLGTDLNTVGSASHASNVGNVSSTGSVNPVGNYGTSGVSGGYGGGFVGGGQMKEFRWLNSASLPIELQCGVVRLELPSAPFATTSPALESMSEAVAACVMRGLGVTDSSTILNWSVSVSVVCNQMVVHEPSLQTLFNLPLGTNCKSVTGKKSPEEIYAALESGMGALACSPQIHWDHQLSFPVRVRDLSLDSLLVFTVKDANECIIGGSTMRLFDDLGRMKAGRQKLLFFSGQPGDTNVLINENSTPGEYYDHFAGVDQKFQMEKNLELFRVRAGKLGSDLIGGGGSLAAMENVLNSRNAIGGPHGNGSLPASFATAVNKYEWLDRLLLKRLEESVEVTSSLEQIDWRDPEAVRAFTEEKWGCPVEELELERFAFLVIDMPILPHPVLYKDRQYPSVEPHQPPASMLEVLAPIILESSIIHGGGPLSGNGPELLEFSLSGRPFQASWLTVVTDWDMDSENLSEDLSRRLVHNVRRGTADSTTRPNKDEKRRIDQILQRVGNQLSGEEMDFLYRFRFSLTENKKALIKFLYAVNWDEEDEVAELPLLLSLWGEKAPIDVADALKLLSKERAFEYPLVREYAVNILRTASDDELLSFLLQLVQALRYEPTKGTSVRPPISFPPVSNPSSPTGTDTHNSLTNYGDSQGAPSPLASFLVERACKSPTLANYLYWYVKVETEDEVAGDMFDSVLNYFCEKLGTQQSSSLFVKRLMGLNEYVSHILSCQRDARDGAKKREGKEAILKQMLVTNGLEKVSPALGWVPLPLDPSIRVDGLIAQSTSMFASAVYPCVIEFTQYMGSVGVDDDEQTSVKSETSSKDVVAKPAVPEKVPTHKIMFKSGDDLRQDQLIMQMISLMDGLLKKVNLDLKLLTYGILAVSQKDGIMEFVRNSMPISGVMKNGSVLDYLRLHNYDKNGPFEVSHEAMDTYVKSTAGISVITYILGVGDRHLDNVMINQRGQLFHIDFGFIFGQDPKPFPPPFRFTRSMADAMGGEDSEHFARFQSYCCQAFNWLRKSANLILNLLSLMGDAGIQDISKRSDLPKVLMKVEEKFRLDLSDEQAEQYFLGLINESLYSLAPKIMEVAHKIAVSMR